MPHTVSLHEPYYPNLDNHHAETQERCCNDDRCGLHRYTGTGVMIQPTASLRLLAPAHVNKLSSDGLNLGLLGLLRIKSVEISAFRLYFPEEVSYSYWDLIPVDTGSVIHMDGYP